MRRKRKCSATNDRGNTDKQFSADLRICSITHKISLDICNPDTIYVRVRRFYNLVFALAAFLWLPASAHCQLESVPGLEFLRCSAETADAHQPDKDCRNCCAVEKAHYRAEYLRLTIPAPGVLLLSLATGIPVAERLPAEVSVGLLTAAPPDLSATWQFSSRTALPVRAPSLAS